MSGAAACTVFAGAAGAGASELLPDVAQIPTATRTTAPAPSPIHKGRFDRPSARASKDPVLSRGTGTCTDRRTIRVCARRSAERGACTATGDGAIGASTGAAIGATAGGGATDTGLTGSAAGGGGRGA